MIDPWAFAAASHAIGGGVEYGPDMDCSRYVGGVLERLCGQRIEPGIWRHVWADLMIRDDARPWSALERIVSEGWGEWADEPPPGRLVVWQGWRKLTELGHVPRPSPSPNGHTGFYRGAEIPLDVPGTVWEANVRRPWSRPAWWRDVCEPYEAGVRLVVLT